MLRGRVIVGWLGFVLLIAASINALIRDEMLTMEVWSYLLLTPLFLFLALTEDAFWVRSDDQDPIELFADEEESSTLEEGKEVSDPIEAGFDIPVS